jgi:23S rRNA pseudouridine1911/1915/1917 synthase
VTVNARKLNDKEGFSSHALLVIDRDDDDYIAHDSGGKRATPQANRRISSEKLLDAMGGKENTAEVTGFKLASQQRDTRLDVYVAEQFPGLSRAAAAKLIEQGKVKINDEAARKAGVRLHTGDKTEIDYDPDKLERIPDIDLPVLYEDSACVVINKPVGVLVHSKGAFNPEATVATWLHGRVKDMDGERAGIVHRLDRATSGVMICAKNPEALSWLQKQFSQRKVKKVYVAIVAGQLEPEHAVIDMPIERNPKAPATFRVGVNGKSASTEYIVENSNRTYSLVKLLPTTGRTHQLRVHLKQMGHPIVGDSLYGGEPAERMFLHALSLEITLPSRERKIFSVPLPPEFLKKSETKSV